MNLVTVSIPARKEIIPSHEKVHHCIMNICFLPIFYFTAGGFVALSVRRVSWCAVYVVMCTTPRSAVV